VSIRTRSLVLAAALAASSVSHAATFQFRFNDGPGEGFNDTTVVTPAGGNTATTLGAARRAVLEEAGRVWGALLQSDVPIVVDATFDPLTCSANSGTLGSAGTTTAFFFNADPATYYVSALADARAGRDLIAETSNPTRADISSRFNSTVNGSAGCLGGNTFYLGFDHNRGNQIDLLAVALHELGHGLGFIALVDLTTGESAVSPGFVSFAYNIFDEQLNQSWPNLSAAERVQSATRGGSLAWNGASVRGYRNRLAQGVTTNGRVRLFAPNPVVTGSSVSHWDTVATPNLLMEPNINSGLTSFLDLTTCALRDSGWTVNRCPDSLNVVPAVPAQTFTVAEDTASNVNLLGTDSENDPLTFAIATNPARGTATAVSGNTIRYTPNANINGTDSFTVTATDGLGTSAAATVTVTITPVNDAPTAAPTSATVRAGQSVNIPGVGTDIDGDTLTYSVVATPANGQTAPSATGITYTANATFSGTDTFTYRANDPNGGSSAPATVTVTVTPPPASGGGGGGGGDMGTVFVVLLSAAAFLRRARARGQ